MSLRALSLAAMVLSVILIPTPAPAQGGGPLLQDAQGDTTFSPRIADTSLPGQDASTEMASHTDLLALNLVESEDAVAFVLAVTSLKGESVQLQSEVSFEWSKREFVLSYGYYNVARFGNQGEYGYLAYSEGDNWNGLGNVDVVVDVEKGTLTAAVPKVYLLDAKDRNPGRGDVLDGIRVASEGASIYAPMFEPRFTDAMPDDKGGAAAFTLQMGDHSQGSVRLGSAERVRVSNGGSTTFVYSVTLSNVADVQHEYDLMLADLPEGWNATVQTPVKVPAKNEKTVAILASVPFAHTHGGYDAFNLTVSSKTDPTAAGKMRFGVLHTPIPQPAGHHNELYLHSRGRSDNPLTPVSDAVDPYGYGTMNTLEDHTEDATYVTVNYRSGEGPGILIPLSPRLRMGLDFDVTRLGAIEGVLDNAPPGDVEVEATLYLFSENDEILLAESEILTLAASSREQLPFALTLTPTEAADYIPHKKDQYLVLLLGVRSSGDVARGRVTEPRLLTESFKMTLPLEEYHDRLTGQADALGILDLVAEGPVEKAGRPGTIVTYQFDLRSGGSTEHAIEMDLAGSDAERAEVVPDGIVTLGPHGSKRVTVAVSIPPDAAAGEELEVLLFAHDVDDPGMTAIARTKTRVSLGEDAVLDESDVLIAARDAENDTPAPGFALVAAGVLAAALAMRRRDRA